MKGVLACSYYLIDLFSRSVVGLKEIFIENIGVILWGEIILLSVIDLRDGAVDCLHHGNFEMDSWPRMYLLLFGRPNI